MKDHLLENRDIQKLFTLLGVCGEDTKPLTAILSEALSGTKEYSLWKNKRRYAFVDKGALEIHDHLASQGANDPENLSVIQIYTAYRELKELRKQIERSEKSIIDDRFDQLDVVRLDWKSYLLKITRRRLFDKILKIDPARLVEIKELGSPVNGSISDIINFLDRLSRIIEPYTLSGRALTDMKNITNLHMANCFRIFTEDIHTDIPQRVLHFDMFDPPFQNLARNMPDGFFCVSRKDYDEFTINMGQRVA